MTTAKRFVSFAEFAETFGVSKRLVANLVARGTLPAVHLGRRRLIPAVVVDRLEESALAAFDPDLLASELPSGVRRGPPPHDR